MSVAAFIAAQRDQHGVPHAVSCRAMGISPAWLDKWLHGDCSSRRGPPGGAGGGGGAPVPAPSRHIRVTEDHRRPQGRRLEGERELRRCADGRAEPGGQEETEAQRRNPAGEGPLTAAGPGETRLHGAGDQPQAM